MATQTANVIDLAACRQARARRQAPAAAHKAEPPAPPAMALPVPLMLPFPGYWLLWVPIVLPHYFPGPGVLLNSK